MWWQVQVVASLAKRSIPRTVRRRVAACRSNPDNDHMALVQGLDFIARIEAAGVPVEGAEVLEIGSGWIPTVPCLLAAHGARQVMLTDVERLADERTFEFARRFVAKETGRVVPWRFDYRAPVDLSEVATDSADIVVSRTVLEHVRKDELSPLFAHMRRILRPGGIMCHLIDHTDHRAHADARLSFVDFLRYASPQWTVIDRLCPSHQNRLRSKDFRSYFWDSGFELLAFDVFTHPTRAFHVPFAPEFCAYTAEELRVCITTAVAQ